MTDEDALLAAAVKTPEDDTLRLAYADYLDEIACEARPDAAPFAKFIRAHILLSTPELKKPGRPWMWSLLAKTAIPIVGAGMAQNEMDLYREELARWGADQRARTEARMLAHLWFSYPAPNRPIGAGVYLGMFDRFLPFVGEGKWNRGFPCAISCTMHYWQVRGPELAKKWPLSKVMFEDRAPYEGTGWYNETPPARRGWARSGPSDPAAWDRAGLPEPIFRLLVGPESATNWYVHPNTERAVSALSDAALEWARSV